MFEISTHLFPVSDDQAGWVGGWSGWGVGCSGTAVGGWSSKWRKIFKNCFLLSPGAAMEKKKREGWSVKKRWLLRLHRS